MDVVETASKSKEHNQNPTLQRAVSNAESAENPKKTTSGRNISIPLRFRHN